MTLIHYITFAHSKKKLKEKYKYTDGDCLMLSTICGHDAHKSLVFIKGANIQVFCGRRKSHQCDHNRSHAWTQLWILMCASFCKLSHLQTSSKILSSIWVCPCNTPKKMLLVHYKGGKLKTCVLGNFFVRVRSDKQFAPDLTSPQEQFLFIFMNHQLKLLIIIIGI